MILFSTKMCQGHFYKRVRAWLVFALLPAMAMAEPIDEIQKSARKWIEIEQEKTRIETDWEWQKSLLESTAKGLESQQEKLKLELDTLEAEQTSERAEVEKLEQEAERLSAELLLTEQHVQRNINELIRLRSMLPPYLSNALNLAFSNLEQTDLSLSEKQQQVGTIVNRCAQFNHTVTYSEEAVYPKRADEGRVMKVVYWGLSHAYALDPQSGDTFVGRPERNQWTWMAKPGLQESLEDLILILNEEEDPEFINIPVQVQTRIEEVGS